MRKKGRRTFIVFVLLCMAFAACQSDASQNDEDKHGPDQENTLPVMEKIDVEAAQQTVESYYDQLINKRYQLALFHIEYEDASKDMIRNVDALEYLETHIDYTVHEFGVEVERTVERDNEFVFVVQVTISYDGVELDVVTERVTVQLVGDTYKIISIRSWDLFIPLRTYNYEITTPPR